MRNFLARWITSAVALGLGAALLGGVALDGVWAALLAAAVLGLLNALLRPVLLLLTLPVNLITLGLFTFVVNAAVLGLTAWFVPDFAIDGIGSALLLAVIVAVVNVVLGRVLSDERR